MSFHSVSAVIERTAVSRQAGVPHFTPLCRGCRPQNLAGQCHRSCQLAREQHGTPVGHASHGSQCGAATPATQAVPYIPRAASASRCRSSMAPVWNRAPGVERWTASILDGSRSGVVACQGCLGAPCPHVARESLHLLLCRTLRPCLRPQPLEHRNPVSVLNPVTHGLDPHTEHRPVDGLMGEPHLRHVWNCGGHSTGTITPASNRKW